MHAIMVEEASATIAATRRMSAGGDAVKTHSSPARAENSVRKSETETFR